MPYIASLDGIRAIAIIAVLVSHVSPSTLKGGFTGVDVFFVLSGFLITSIILRDIREGSFSIREFYLRRIQRLLPNVIVMVLVSLFLWTLLLPPTMSSQPGKHGLCTLFNLSNICTWRSLGDYWGGSAEFAPLTHTWSLGVEEQFYLLFPSFLLLLVRFQSGWVRSWLIIATAFSFGLCLYGTRAHAVATFYLLPTRVWELLLGAILAAYRTPLSTKGIQPWIVLRAKAREAIGWMGLGLIALGFVVISEANTFPGWVTLAPTVGTVLLCWSVADEETRVSRILSSPFMVGTGKFSYSLYLWHWPLIALGKLQADFHGFPQLVGAVVGGLAGVLLAWLAYVYVEQPLRHRGPDRSRRFVTIIAGFSLVVLYCGFLAFRRPIPNASSRFDTLTSSSQLFNAGRIHTIPIGHYDVHCPLPPPRPNDSWRTGGIVHLHGRGDPQIVVMGSSHALMYSKLVDNICREMGVSVAFLGMFGPPPFFQTKPSLNFPSSLEAQEFDEVRRKKLREWRPAVVFAIDIWDQRAKKMQNFDAQLRSFLREVSPLTERVIFVAQVPVLPGGNSVNLRDLVTWRMGKSGDLPRFFPNSMEHFRKETIAIAEGAATDFQSLRVLRADLPFYREDGSIRYASGRDFFYIDDNHLTDTGAEEVRPLFKKAIAEALKASDSR